jgi:predicted dehydrogenase
MSARLRVGVVGAGAWGRNHVRTLASLAGAELAAVCDTGAAVREKLARQYPAVLVTDDVAKLLDAVEAVVIASPAITHADLARQAIAAGVPALVEKPFALSVADAEDLAARAAKANVPLMAGHLLEYHPVVERLRELIADGSLGQVYYLYGQRVNLGQVRRDENALWSFGPHDVSVALFLLGTAPKTVTAVGRSYLQRGIEDVVFLTMEFASGALAHVQLSWLDPHKERRLTVVGSKQMAVFDDMQPREKLRLYDKGIDRPPEYQSFGESLQIREGDIFIPRLPNAEPLVQELTHFVRVARREVPARSDASDGVRVVRVLAAATESLRRDGQPIGVTVS